MPHDYDEQSPTPRPSDGQTPDTSGDGGAGTAADRAATPTRKRWIVSAGVALGVALFAVPFLRGPDEHPPADTHALVGTTGPACASPKGRANYDFTLKDVKGGEVRMADYRGKVVLVNFWATWCGPCKVEIPEFVDAYSRYREKGFEILGVLSEDDPSPEQLRSFMDGFKMNYPVLRQHDEFAASFGELYGLPTSFVIDRNGSICSKHMGAVSGEALEREIKGLL